MQSSRDGEVRAFKTRPILANFAFYPKREKIRKLAKIFEGTMHQIGQQKRRKQLVPILKDAKSKGQIAHIAVDKLYIEGKLYNAAHSPGSANSKDSPKSSGTHRPSNSHIKPPPEGARGFSILDAQDLSESGSSDISILSWNNEGLTQEKKNNNKKIGFNNKISNYILVQKKTSKN